MKPHRLHHRKNYNLLIETLRRAKKQEAFYMLSWNKYAHGKRVKLPTGQTICGTAACVGGWARRLFQTRSVPEAARYLGIGDEERLRYSDGPWGWICYARNYTSRLDSPGERLFCPNELNAPTDEAYKIAIARLKWLRDNPKKRKEISRHV